MYKNDAVKMLTEHVNLLSKGEEGKRYNALLKILIHLGIIIHYVVEKIISRYYLEAFGTEEKFECHFKD